MTLQRVLLVGVDHARSLEPVVLFTSLAGVVDVEQRKMELFKAVIHALTSALMQNPANVEVSSALRLQRCCPDTSGQVG